MKRTVAESCLVWLAGLSYLVVTLAGATLVLCDNGQDRRHLELGHLAHACLTEDKDASSPTAMTAAAAMPVVSVSDCQDISLSHFILSDPAPIVEASHLPALLAPPVLLMELFWPTPGSLAPAPGSPGSPGLGSLGIPGLCASGRSGLAIGLPATHRHLLSIGSTLLLI